MKQNSRALQHVWKVLQRGREFILAAVKQNSRALQHIWKVLRRGREFLLATMKRVKDDRRRDVDKSRRGSRKKRMGSYTRTRRSERKYLY